MSDVSDAHPRQVHPPACRSAHGRPVDVFTPACSPVTLSACAQAERVAGVSCGLAMYVARDSVIDDVCHGGECARRRMLLVLW